MNINSLAPDTEDIFTHTIANLISACALIFFFFKTLYHHVRIQRGGEGVGSGPPSPLENYKNIGFLNKTGSDPLKITKLPIQHSILGHQLPASETSFKWRFAGGPLMSS